MRSLEFEDLTTGKIIRRKGTKNGLLSVVKRTRDKVFVKFVETKFQQAEGINDKEYKITRDEFYQLGYVAI